MSSEKVDDLDISSIKSPKDEYSYWNGLSVRYDLKADVIDRAHFFAEQLQPLAARFNNFQDRSLNEVLEMIDSSQDILDNVWKFTNFTPYPEQRMSNLFKITGQLLVNYLVAQIGSLKLWTDSFSNVRDPLRKAVLVCQNWTSVTDTLTSKFWKSFDKHTWAGKKYEDEDLVLLGQRIDEIFAIRNLQDSITKLLSVEEQNDIKAERIFDAFIGINVLNYKGEGASNWKTNIKGEEKINYGINEKFTKELWRHSSREQLPSYVNSSLDLATKLTSFCESIKSTRI
jgi:dynein heavy chain 2